MGCDIHMFTEARKPIYGVMDKRMHEEKWSSINYYVKEADETFRIAPLYSDRYYALFGRLAGVRDGSVPAIDNPRGIPHDVCPEIKAEWNESKDWCHSASHLTLQELEDNCWPKGSPFSEWDPETDPIEEIIEILKRRWEDFYYYLQPIDKKFIRIVFWFDS